MYKGTVLDVLDNSGARTAAIIRVLKSKKEHAAVGSTVVVAVKTAQIDKKIKRHDVKIGTIIQTRKRIFRNYHGTSLYFNKNAMIIFGRGNNPIATRIKGAVAQELRYTKCVKLLMMAPSVI